MRNFTIFILLGGFLGLLVPRSELNLTLNSAAGLLVFGFLLGFVFFGVVEDGSKVSYHLKMWVLGIQDDLKVFLARRSERRSHFKNTLGNSNTDASSPYGPSKQNDLASKRQMTDFALDPTETSDVTYMAALQDVNERKFKNKSLRSGETSYIQNSEDPSRFEIPTTNTSGLNKNENDRLKILKVVDDSPEVSVGQLQQELGLAPTTIITTLDQLVEEGVLYLRAKDNYSRVKNDDHLQHSEEQSSGHQTLSKTLSDLDDDPQFFSKRERYESSKGFRDEAKNKIRRQTKSMSTFDHVTTWVVLGTLTVVAAIILVPKFAFDGELSDRALQNTMQTKMSDRELQIHLRSEPWETTSERLSIMTRYVQQGRYKPIIKAMDREKNGLVSIKEKELYLAAFYGLGEYQTALEKACSFKSKDDVFGEFLPHIQANLRGIAVNAGYERARSVALNFQARCGSDFSPLLAGINYGQMEKFFERSPRFSHNYSLSNGDIKYLRSTLGSNSDDPYAPLAHYFLDDFQLAIESANILNIHTFALVDRAAIGGQPEDIRQLFDQSWALKPEFISLDFDTTRLLSKLCEEYAARNDYSKAKEILASGVFRENEKRVRCIEPILASVTTEKQIDNFNQTIDLIEFLNTEDVYTDVGKRISATSKLVSEVVKNLEHADQLPLIKTALNTFPTYDDKRNFIRALIPEVISSMSGKGLSVLTEELDLDESSFPPFKIEGMTNALLADYDNYGLERAIEKSFAVMGVSVETIDLILVRAADAEHDFNWYSEKTDNLPAAMSLLARVKTVRDEQNLSEPAIRRWWTRSIVNRFGDAADMFFEAHTTEKGIVAADGLIDMYSEMRDNISENDAKVILDEIVGGSIVEHAISKAEQTRYSWEISSAQAYVSIANSLKRYGSVSNFQADRLKNINRNIDEQLDFKCGELVAMGIEREPAPLRRCLEINPTNEMKGRSLYLLASIARENGNWEESREYMERFIDEIPEHGLLDDIYAELGWQYYRSKDYKSAKALLQTAIDKFSDLNAHDNALYWMAKVNEKTNSRKKALDIYTRIFLLDGADRLRRVAFKDLAQTSSNIESDLFLVTRWGEDLTVKAVEEHPSLSSGKLKKNDRIISFCGIPVGNFPELLEVLDAQKETSNGELITCELDVRRRLSMRETTVTMDVSL